jgi:hypothetical protein
LIYDTAFSLPKKVSKWYIKVSDLYKVFAKDWEHCLDFSEEMRLEMYISESHGLPVSEKNGYFHGKKWMSVNVTMWKEDIENGLLFKQELYQDGRYPEWWLDGIFKNE